MIELLDFIREHDALLWWLGAASIFTFIGTLIGLPILVARIPADYFSRSERPQVDLADRPHPVLRVLLICGKNILGAVFILAGVAMLVLPGQGLLCILIGVLLIDFPGKYRFERWLVRRRGVLKAINWMRHRAGRPPLIIDEPV